MTNSTEAPKIIAVYGATGAQGGSVVRSLVQNKAFRVRAITRNPSSKAAQELKALGAELVQADGWKQDTIKAAVAECWAVFANTNSDDPCFAAENGPTEFDLGRSIINGIVEAGTVRHFVYSSTISTSALTEGRFAAKAAEEKSRVERYAVDLGYFESVCPIYAGWYMEMFASKEMAPVFGGFPFIADDEGIITLRLPRWGATTDLPVPWISIQEDFGDIVHGVLLEPLTWNQKVIPALSDPISLPQVANAFQTVTGKKARYECLSSWEQLGVGIPQLEDQRMLFAFGQLTNGKYFGDVPTEVTIPAHLKRQASIAKGTDWKESGLMTMEKWFQGNLA